jgi:hypothetical protein
MISLVWMILEYVLVCLVRFARTVSQFWLAASKIDAALVIRGTCTS